MNESTEGAPKYATHYLIMKGFSTFSDDKHMGGRVNKLMTIGQYSKDCANFYGNCVLIRKGNIKGIERCFQKEYKKGNGAPGIVVFYALNTKSSVGITK